MVSLRLLDVLQQKNCVVMYYKTRIWLGVHLFVVVGFSSGLGKIGKLYRHDGFISSGVVHTLPRCWSAMIVVELPIWLIGGLFFGVFFGGGGGVG
jgi:hypothetical protein